MSLKEQTSSLLLIDVSHLFWSAWHAGADKDIGFAFDATITKVHSLRNGYDYVAICCDAPPYWRKELLPTYKANREAAPPAAIEQFKRTKERLRKDGLLLWEARGFEADDIIATAVSHARDFSTVDIASSDKDLMQLISDAEGISMVSTRDGKRYNEAEVREKYGVPPELIADSLALQGDSSDNIPGIKGVGPKTAAELLNTYGSMTAVFENVDKIKQPARQIAIAEGAPNARLARKLVELRTDAPIRFEELFEERKQEPLANDDGYEDGFDESESAEDIPISPPPSPKEEPSAPKVEVLPKQNGNGNGHAAEPETAQTAIVPIAPVEWSLGLEPRTITAAFGLAKGLLNSRLYSKFPNSEAILAVIIRGREMGLGALTALDCFHVVEGKPCLSAHLIVAKAKKHEDCEYFQFVGGDGTFAEYETKNRRNPRPTRLKYTIAQAKEAGLCVPPRDGKQAGNWIKRPAEMLRKTAAVQLVRIEYPDAALGLYSLEEMGVDS